MRERRRWVLRCWADSEVVCAATGRAQAFFRLISTVVYEAVRDVQLPTALMFRGFLLLSDTVAFGTARSDSQVPSIR